MVTIRDNIGLADAATSTQTGTVGEPSAAASWSGMFITGNWYASRSADAGRTWTFVDPFTSFPADRGEFCCDQLVLWEPKRKFWVWLLQYSQLGGTNIFRVAVSPDAAPGSWHTWEVTPADVNPTWKSWFDYPDMAVSDDHLYISFNQYSTSDAWLRASVFRYSLDELDGLARGQTGPLTREQWTTTQHGSLRFVVGAGDTMWWASNDIDAGALHVFAWPDASAAVESWVVRVGAWNGDDYTAPGPANAAWLNRCDDRVTGGWRTAGAGGARLGWLWSSGRTANRPMPFIRAVTIDESSLRVVAEPDVWSPTIAWAYPAAGSSRRGRVGLSAFFGSATQHPTHAVGILATDGLSWSTKRTAASTHSPLQGKWGDYVTVKPHPRRPTSLVATGFTMQGGQDRRNVEPRVVTFAP